MSEILYQVNDLADAVKYNDRLIKKNKELFKEIEILNKQIKEYQKALDETTSEKIDLENIIKEVREYIESYMPNYDFDKTNLIKLLEILKGEIKSE